MLVRGASRGFAPMIRIILRTVFASLITFHAAMAQPEQKEPYVRDGYHEVGLKSTATLRVVYYFLHGDAPQLDREMLERGPADHHGRRRFALTSWNISWRWPQKDGFPVLERAGCKLHITVTLPRWYPLRSVDDRAKQAWGEFTRKLAAHEKRHIEIAEERFPNVCKALHDAAASGRRLTQFEANRLAQRELQKIRKAEELFDRATDNGRAEGVRWPNLLQRGAVTVRDSPLKPTP